MLFVVAQNSQLLQPNIERQFKKLAFSRLLFNNIFLFLIQYSGFNLSNLSPSPAPVWFATGTSCSFLFLRGYSVLPGIWLGNFLAYFLGQTGFGFAMCFSTVICWQAVMLLWFSYRYLSPTLIFYKLKVYMQFVAFTVVLTASTSLMLIFLDSLSMPNQEISWGVGLNYCLGNLNAILIFSCAYITWDAYFSRAYTLKPLHRLLRNTFYAILACVTLALVLSSTQTTTFVLALISFLVTMIISASFGWCGAMTATFVSAIVISFAALLGAPVFFTPFAASTLLFLQWLLCAQTIIGLSIAIERHKQG